MLVVFAGRHYRELSNQNELRPQDVMRILVHYHAYGNVAQVADLVERYSGLIQRQIDAREEDEVGRLMAESQVHAEELLLLEQQIAAAKAENDGTSTKRESAALAKKVSRLEKQLQRPTTKLAERDELIVAARQLAASDRAEVLAVGNELTALYADPSKLITEAQVVDLATIAENDFSLNVPRYVDTFEPEAVVDIHEAVTALEDATSRTQSAQTQLMNLLREAGIDA